MKKLFLSLVALLLVATATYAQKNYVATLTHDGTVRTFYGTGALIEANAQAEDGDVITLSSGIFQGTTITKGITLKGAGMEDNEEEKITKTVVRGDLTINLQDTEALLTIEDISMDDYYKRILIANCKNGILKKCKGSFLNYNTYDVDSQNVNFIQCICNEVEHDSGRFTAINSLVKDLNVHYDREGATFLNCTMLIEGRLINIDFVNCVISRTIQDNGHFIDASCTIENCLDYLTAPKPTYYSLFKEDTFYQLTDEAKTKVIGTDGTEIGMYGGQYPYNPIPDGARITKFNVASKSSADNKLSVDIEVSSAE